MSLPTPGHYDHWRLSRRAPELPFPFTSMSLAAIGPLGAWATFSEPEPPRTMAAHAHGQCESAPRVVLLLYYRVSTLRCALAHHGHHGDGAPTNFGHLKSPLWQPGVRANVDSYNSPTAASSTCEQNS